MAIYLGNTLLTGSSSGSEGGGGGILNVQEFTSSGSFDPAAAGLSVGDKIIVEAVSGGGGGVSANSFYGTNMTGGCGGNYKVATYTLTSTSAITVTVGAGGTKDTTNANSATAGAGGTTSVIGSGVSLTLTGGPGGANDRYSELLATSKGPHFGAVITNADDPQSFATNAGPGVNGYGVGGGVFNSSYASAGGAWGGAGTNPGCGGRSGGGSGNSSAGVAGMVKIYY